MDARGEGGRARLLQILQERAAADRVAGLPTNFDTSQLEASFHIGDADLNEGCLPEADAYDCNSDGDDADDFDEFE